MGYAHLQMKIWPAHRMASLHSVGLIISEKIISIFLIRKWELLKKLENIVQKTKYKLQNWKQKIRCKWLISLKIKKIHFWNTAVFPSTQNQIKRCRENTWFHHFSLIAANCKVLMASNIMVQKITITMLRGAMGILSLLVKKSYEFLEGWLKSFL